MSKHLRLQKMLSNGSPTRADSQCLLPTQLMLLLV